MDLSTSGRGALVYIALCCGGAGAAYMLKVLQKRTAGRWWARTAKAQAGGRHERCPRCGLGGSCSQKWLLRNTVRPHLHASPGNGVSSANLTSGGDFFNKWNRN